MYFHTYLATKTFITMKSTYSKRHGTISLFFFFLLSLSPAAAQPSQPSPNPDNMYARFSPSMAVIIAVLVAALFFMGFFSIYIRHCYDASAGSNVGAALRRGSLSLHARRNAARGLDASAIEALPTFSYSEVKDHKIGKGALECAVCLNEFEDDETLRLLPKCDHVFHPDCIDAWLASHTTCPVCRANLALQTGPDPVQPEETHPPPVEADQSRDEEIVIQVDEDDHPQPSDQRNLSFETPNRPARSWSIRRPKMLGFGKFRSHSTGHSLVQPGENLDRFTLRLPEGVRKEVMDRAMLNRTRSLAAGLQREGSSRKGYRTGGEEGSSRAGRFYKRLELPGRGANSDRWVFFTRGVSFRSPRVVADSGEGSSSKRSGGKTPVKMPSFKCLEPKTGGDENRPFSEPAPV